MTTPDAQRMAALEASNRELVYAANESRNWLAHILERMPAGDHAATQARLRMLDAALANARALQQPSQGERGG